MLRNYIVVAFRNLRKQKVYSFINISGLALGMASCFLILMWVADELSFDRFNENIDHLYRAVYENRQAHGIAREWAFAGPLASALKSEFPEIEYATRFTSWGRARLVKSNDKAFMEANIKYVDDDFFHMFTFPFVAGDKNTAFDDPGAIVVTESMAKKYFGDEDPLGKQMVVDNKMSLVVSGVVADVPQNSHLQFDFLIPFIKLEEFGVPVNSWGFWAFHTYVLLSEHAVFDDVNLKINEFRKEVTSGLIVHYLQPVKEIYLYGLGEGERITYVYVFSVAAVLVLCIACINFMNLSTARSSKRSKEVGLRKVVGAFRRDLIKQFFGESLFISFIALLFAAVLIVLFLPLFNTISGKTLILNYTNAGMAFVGLLVITLFTGVLSGSYPSLFLSSFRPVDVLKGTFLSSTRGSGFRRLLVVTQFSISIILIVCSVIIYEQLQFVREKNLGFDREHRLSIPIRGNILDNYDALKNEMLSNPQVQNVTVASALPSFGESGRTTNINWERKDPENALNIHWISVGYDYVETFGIEMVRGRDFSADFETDSTNSYILNERAAREMGLKSPVGKEFSFWESKGTIIGIVRDFHFSTLRNEVGPLVMRMSKQHYNFIVVKIKPDNVSATIDYVEGLVQKFNPDFPFAYSFMDSDFDKIYRSEEKIGAIINAFTFIAIFVSCLGLFGLASFIAQQYAKEFGIRKVLGSTVRGLVFLMSKNFVKWIAIASIISWPVSYYIMHVWLQNFAYRIDISVSIFLMAGIGALLIALFTVSYQALKSALANPIDSLRYE